MKLTCAVWALMSLRLATRVHRNITPYKKSPARGRGLKDISKVRLVNEYIPAERILDLASLYGSDVVVELERLRTALAVAISIDSLFL